MADFCAGEYYSNDVRTIEVAAVGAEYVILRLKNRRTHGILTKRLKIEKFETFLRNHNYRRGLGSSAADIVVQCDCGAQYTSFPNAHYDWCTTLE